MFADGHVSVHIHLLKGKPIERRLQPKKTFYPAHLQCMCKIHAAAALHGRYCDLPPCCRVQASERTRLTVAYLPGLQQYQSYIRGQSQLIRRDSRS